MCVFICNCVIEVFDWLRDKEENVNWAVVYLVLVLVRINIFRLKHQNRYKLYGFHDLIMNQYYVIQRRHRLTTRYDLNELRPFPS